MSLAIAVQEESQAAMVWSGKVVVVTASCGRVTNVIVLGSIRSDWHVKEAQTIIPSPLLINDKPLLLNQLL